MFTFRTYFQTKTVPFPHKRVDNIPYTQCLLQRRPCAWSWVEPLTILRVQLNRGDYLVLAYQAAYFVIIWCLERRRNSIQLDRSTRNEGFSDYNATVLWRCFEI